MHCKENILKFGVECMGKKKVRFSMKNWPYLGNGNT